MIKSIDKIRKLIGLGVLLLLSQALFAQILTLEEAFQLARQNYPLLQKQTLIQEATRYSLENASKSFLPQLQFSGQATYQSDVTRIPASIPGVKEMSKDQYRAQGEISQLIYDGGVIRNQKDFLHANEAIQLQNVEVGLNSLKERIAQLYFSILLFDAQLQQRHIFKQNLTNALKRAEENLKEGTTFKSSVNELKVEIINADISETEIVWERKGYRDMLAQLIGKPLSDETQFVEPPPATVSPTLNRPELKLYDLQKKAVDVQAQKLQTDLMPRLSAFVQGGYGRPGLNMLDDNFAPFAIGGVRFSLPLGSLYTFRNNKAILDINRKQIEADKETFILNTKASLQKENSEIVRYQELMKQDDEIIALREEIAKSARAQLANGVITTNEYINKLNAENLARQMKNLHKVQLLKAQTNYQTIAGY